MLKTILCVDDDPITLMLCKKVIKKAEFSEDVMFANNGQEAYELFQSLVSKKNKSEEFQLPQLIFLDLNMPVMNGWEFLQAYHNLGENIKSKVIVVMLTTSDNPDDEAKAKAKK